LLRPARPGATLLRESAADTCQVRALVESVADLNKTRTAFIDAINDRVETSVENMEKVTRSVAAVEKLLNLIEKLGLQTDLLALNATIEAARAGVHGAGFGVVALEMRQLADRTASITKQIYANMHEMRVSTRNTASTLLEARRMGGESRQLGDTGRKNLSDCIDYTLHTEELFRDFQARAKQNGAASVSLDEKWNIAAKVEAPRDAPAQANRETIALCLRVLEEMQHLETRPVSPSVGSLKANGLEMLNTA
jgi:methyl-accepting chemotaxis protein